MMYAEIALNRPVHQTFTYSIPAAIDIQIGQMVRVPFRTAHETGIVLSLSSEKPSFATKKIIERLDPRPVLTPAQIALGRWMAEATQSPLGFCLWLMLPPGINQKSDELYHLSDPAMDGSTPTEKQIISTLKRRGDLTGEQLERSLTFANWRRTMKGLVAHRIIEAEPVLAAPRVRPQVIRTALLSLDPAHIPALAPYLGRESKGADVLEILAAHPRHLMPIKDVLDAAGVSKSVIDTLAKNGDVIVYSGEKTVELVQPSQVSERIVDLRGGRPYLDILNYLALMDGAARVSEIYQHTGTDIRHLETLHEEGYITLGESEVWRDSLAEKTFTPAVPPSLTSDQVEVWEPIRKHMQKPKASRVFLLHGVTGSGKTEVYMQAVTLALAQGRQAIIMVPEIALTAQMVQRFASRFPGQVALIHSTLSPGERYDTWRRARDGQIKVIIGARSALFAPFANVGLIILDEEHDDSYKQSPPINPPYYHAREAAVKYMEINKGTVILGSATPDVTSYFKAEQGIYTLLHLPDRILAHRDQLAAQREELNVAAEAPYTPLVDSDAVYQPLPPVQVVDMRQELRVGHVSVFSRALITAINEMLALGQQAVLFLNRRGTATYVFCRECGYIAECSRCDAPLTFHQPQAKLVCHRCGNQQENPKVCPQCGSKRIKYFGRGTEQIEQILKTDFPHARVLRWDQDTASKRGAHEEIFTTFAARRADILIGTQMITKGLDLPLVTLVGIISGDTALGLPDYRAGENTFQLLTQVAGRAGRGLLGGRVILQTYQPDHYAIQAAAHHDYHRFYDQEIQYRRDLHYPPFTRLARLQFINRIEAEARHKAEHTAERLFAHAESKGLPMDIIGPAPAFFGKINDLYRWHLLIRTADPVALLLGFEIPPDVRLDIDPLDVL